MMSHDMAAKAGCRGFDIAVNDVPGQPGFVTGKEIRELLKKWDLYKTDGPASEVDIYSISRRLNRVPAIESATVQRMPDNTIRVRVTPMEPVARVFGPDGKSYYINSDGKRLSASSHFRIDVPVIAGSFDSKHPVTDLLPLVKRIEGDPQWKEIVSHYSVDPKTRDIIITPMIRGHVINLGDTTALESKLARVMTMYHKVLPIKGWEYYDTLSVKWGGQCVATCREKSLTESMILFDQEGEAETDDIDAMLTTVGSDTVHTDTPAYVN